jgi:hypothetical protein
MSRLAASTIDLYPRVIFCDIALLLAFSGKLTALPVAPLPLHGQD